MTDESYIRPAISPEDALGIARTRFDVRADRAEPLPSDRDQNILLTEEASGRRYVLKLAHAGEDRGILDLQNRMLEHLARGGFSLSKVLFATDGEEMVEVPGPDGSVFLARLLTWVPGTLLSSVRPPTPELFRNLGAFLGGMDRALEDFSHPAQDRELKWDLKGAGRVVRSHLELVKDPARRGLLGEMTDRFLERLGPLVPSLRMSVIHGDANDNNVLVSPLGPDDTTGARSVTGIVDFGDAVRSFTCGEAAVAGAYAMLEKADPFPFAAGVVKGYNHAFPLRQEEIAALFPLMGLRLCTSVAISAFQKAREPDNEYLTVSEEPAWALLERLERESLDLPWFLFRQACGLEPVPGAATVASWLQAHGPEAAPVVETADGPAELSTTPTHVFDLSVDTLEFSVGPEPEDAEGWTDLLFRTMKNAGVEVGVGRYDEVRRWYTSDLFRSPGDAPPEWRTVHMGVDLFLGAGTPVCAPFEAIVHSVALNDGPLDYGPAVILEHTGPTFWTLYGHLAPEVLEELRPGQRVERGQAFARIGTYPRNGNWAPHLHFQIITHLMGMEGDFPGVALPSRRELFRTLSPDPNLILRMPQEPASGAPLRPDPGRTTDQILELRARHLGPNLSVAYDRPLKIVRGWKQFLYDEEGQAYLDCVNNVPHVGHSHPGVVEAGQRQMAVLNTNTRYLHDLTAEYALRLASLLPDPLSVVYFVCTGSEANELALRLARAHTGRRDVIVVEGAYHGHTSSLIELSPYKFDGPGGFPARDWVHKTLMPDPYRGVVRNATEELTGDAASPFVSGGSRERGAGEKVPVQYLPPDRVGPSYAEDLREALAEMEAEGRAPAAFFAEPLLGCGGQIVPPPGYLAAAFDHVRGAGGVCVADEVQVGFGRVGTHLWAFEAQGAVPDIVTLGKPMGNGHPLAAVVTTPEIAASFDTGMEYFNTFGGNPVSCAIGMAVLDVLEEEGLQANAREVGEHLLTGLRKLMPDHPLLGDVRGLGLYVGAELVKDRNTREPATALAGAAKERLRDHRILVSTDGPDENVLKIKPPLVFTKDDAERLVDTLDRVLKEDVFQS